jgi:hypothetical protein
VQQPILSRAPIGRAAGEEDSGTAHAEEGVGDEHRLFVPLVEVLRDVLGRDDERALARIHLEQVLGEVNRHNPGGAAHPA